MATQSTTLTWTQLLAALRACGGNLVLLRDGRETKPADSIRTRPAAAGTELCLFSGDSAPTRDAIVTRLETLAKASGRRFMTSAKANVGGANLLIEGAVDETIDGTAYAVVVTRRPKLGFNQSQGTAPSALGRSSKQIKTG